MGEKKYTAYWEVKLLVLIISILIKKYRKRKHGSAQKARKTKRPLMQNAVRNARKRRLKCRKKSIVG